MGVSSTEEGAKGGTAKSPPLLGHELLGQVDGERRIHSEDIPSVPGSSLKTKVLGGTLKTEEMVDELGVKHIAEYWLRQCPFCQYLPHQPPLH